MRSWPISLLAALGVVFFVPLSLAADGRGLARVPAHEKRVALVIGNSGYRHAGHLDNPDNDARLIAKTLQGLGFGLVGGKALLDLDKKAMDEAVQAFGRELGPDSVALFYYAGHGNEIGGTNYLLPVDANPFKPSDFDFQTLNAGTVLRQMQDAGTRLNIVILDACRDNPFGGRGLRAAAAGLASMEPPAGTLIAYAAGVGKKAQDGPPDGNSPYSAALAQAMAQTGLPLWQTFNAVGLRVKETTGGVQTPWISNEPIQGGFCFAGCETKAEPSPAPNPAAVELAFWDSIKTSDNAADFEEYLRQFPQGRFAVPAKSAIKRLRLAENVPLAVPVQSATPPPKPAADFGIEMVAIPAGEFWMGSDDSDKEADDDEKPRHQVKVRAFKLGKTEVTQGQWQAVMGSNPSEFTQCGDACPVERVSFDDAQIFIRTLNTQTGKAYRLPTEAEWEYAARAGTATARYWGNNSSGACAYANVYDRTGKASLKYSWEAHDCKDGYTHTAPAGQFKPNGFGLQDMLGNVWEWTCSAYAQHYDGSENKCTNNAGIRRAVRGGAWYNDPQYARSANRDRGNPTNRNFSVGFRLAQD